MSDLQQSVEMEKPLDKLPDDELKNSNNPQEKESLHWKEELQKKQALTLGRIDAGWQLAGLEAVRNSGGVADRQLAAWKKDVHTKLYGKDSEGAKLNLKEEGGEMGGIQLGDNTTHNYPAAVIAPTVNPIVNKKTFSTLAKAALLAAGVATGGGAAMALPSILSFFNNETEDPITKFIEGDSEGLRILPPKVIEPE